MIGSPTKRRWVLAAVMAAVLIGCSHDSKRAAPPTTTIAAAITTTTTAQVNAAVTAAWRHYWDVYVAVGSEMHLPDARLAEVATGEELRQLGGGFLAFSSDGQIIRGTVDLDPRVVSIDGTTATLKDCYLSHILRYDKATGAAKGSAPTSRSLVTVTLQLENGAWKVSAIKHEGDGCTDAS